MITMHFLAPTYTTKAQIDHVTADWNGQTFTAKSRSGALCAMARLLRDQGCPEQPWSAQRGGGISMSGPSLHALAGVYYGESDKGGLKRAKWVPRVWGEDTLKEPS